MASTLDNLLDQINRVSARDQATFAMLDRLTDFIEDREDISEEARAEIASIINGWISAVREVTECH